MIKRWLWDKDQPPFSVISTFSSNALRNGTLLGMGGSGAGHLARSPVVTKNSTKSKLQHVGVAWRRWSLETQDFL